MTSDAKDLADSLIRFHGAVRAVKLADRYALEAAAAFDERGHAKWAQAAAWIAHMIELSERFDQPAQA